MPTSFLAITVGLFLLVVAPPEARAILFADDTFDDADWNTIVEIRGIGTTGSGTATQQSSGGNPDEYREVISSRDPDSAGLDNSTRVISIYDAMSYDPSTMGAIATIDFVIDGIQLSPQCCSGGSLAPVVMQDGIIYQNFASEPMPELDWTTHDFLGLDQNSFFVVGSPSMHPDFSDTGGSLNLGWVYVISSASGDPVTRTVGFDNWMMVVNPVVTPVAVPEPSTLTLMAAGLAGFALVRRRRVAGGL